MSIHDYQALNTRFENLQKEYQNLSHNEQGAQYKADWYQALAAKYERKLIKRFGGIPAYTVEEHLHDAIASANKYRDRVIDLENKFKAHRELAAKLITLGIQDPFFHKELMERLDQIQVHHLP